MCLPTPCKNFVISQHRSLAVTDRPLNYSTVTRICQPLMGIVQNEYVLNMTLARRSQSSTALYVRDRKSRESVVRTHSPLTSALFEMVEIPTRDY